jgi:hypothetical protein
MFIEFKSKTQVLHKRTYYQLLVVFTVLVCALTFHPADGHAQTFGKCDVDIPFPFYAGNAKLPAGTYTLHLLDDSVGKIMEISAVDGSASTLFDVENAGADSAPPNSELVFNKDGARYFLARIFVEDNTDGSRVLESEYEKRLNEAAAERVTLACQLPGEPLTAKEVRQLEKTAVTAADHMRLAAYYRFQAEQSQNKLTDAEELLKEWYPMERSSKVPDPYPHAIRLVNEYSAQLEKYSRLAAKHEFEAQKIQARGNPGSIDATKSD